MDPRPSPEHFTARGSIDYMLRTMQQHHASLSSMADQKANILVGVSLLMLTLMLTRMPDAAFSIGALTLSVFTLVAASFALMAVTPSLKRVKPDSPEFNPLFFGHFADMEPEAYFDHMRSIMQDDAQVYETIVKDIHQLGRVLHRRKYRYLTYSYRVFLVGILVSFLTVIIEWVVAGGPA